MDILNHYKLILASKSPRRKELLSKADIPFTVQIKEVKEVYPSTLRAIEVPVFLSKLKASVFELETGEIVLTADTLVMIDDEILGKPKDFEEAVCFLEQLSGRSHQVITGYTLKSNDKTYSNSIVSDVTMESMSLDEIEYYINKYKPYDKAGSYGIQEWIGYTKVMQIKGSYFNIMGLPIHDVYKALRIFCKN